MHARQLIEIAGLVGLRATPLLRGDASICQDALSEYWIASRCRLDHWGRSLRSLGHSQSAPPSDGGDVLLSLAEELILSETLTRIIAAVCHAADARDATEDAGPIGRNALDAQRESLSRLRALTFAWWAADSPKTRHVRSLAKQAEQWTDVLLAYVSFAANIDHLAHDVSRVREYAYDSQLHGAEASGAASQLLLYALRTGFASATQPPITGELNRRVAGAALALFGPGGFDGHGLSRPAWMLRAERTAEDTVAMVDRLFADEQAADRTRLPERWRI